MASRGGLRAKGTDGNDFLHREKVADHYAVSALNKSRIKWTVLFHVLIFLIMVARVVPDLLTLAQLDIQTIIKTPKLPRAELWELAWIPSIIASIFASLSLKRNKSSLLWQAILGQILLGLGPISYGLYDIYPDLQQLMKNKSLPGERMDFPFTVLRFAWMAIALQVHLFQIYFAKTLISAWRSASGKKVK